MAKVDDVVTSNCPPARGRAADLGVLGLRLTAGGLLAGHGAQKLFGAFGGHGLEGTAGFLESIGLRPGKSWAMLAAASEFGGGALTALGLWHPLGPVAIQGAMVTAARTVHRGKPIWSHEGGAELPALNMAIGLALFFTGPGRYSVDRTFGISLSKTKAAFALAAVGAGIVAAERLTAAHAETNAAGAESQPVTSPSGEDVVVATPTASSPIEDTPSPWLPGEKPVEPPSVEAP